MIPDPDVLLRRVARHAAEEGVPVPVTLATMRDIVAEAEQLAAGRAEDEPAALFYACARRARLFGRVATRFVEMVGGAQAGVVGLRLDATELDTILLHGRLAYGAADWIDVRDTFAGWLRPCDEPPKRRPARRPQ
jgi:hypothetical protein